MPIGDAGHRRRRRADPPAASSGSSKNSRFERRPALLVAPDVGQRMGVVAVGDVGHRRRDGAARFLDDLEPVLVHLHRRDAGRQRLLDPRPRALGVVVLVEARHHRHAACAWRRPACAETDLLRRLAGDVPQRDVDRGQRVQHRAGAAEAREALARREVQRLAIVDRLAEIVRRDRVADGGEQRPLHRRPQRQAFAVALEAVARRHARQGQAERVRRPARGMRSAMGSMRSMIMAVQFDSARSRCQRFRRWSMRGEYRMAVDKFTTSDGIRLAYYIDDYTDPVAAGRHPAAAARRRRPRQALLCLGAAALPALSRRAARPARPRRIAGAAGVLDARHGPPGRRRRGAARPSRRQGVPHRRQLGRRLHRAEPGDEVAGQGEEPDAVRLDRRACATARRRAGCRASPRKACAASSPRPSPTACRSTRCRRGWSTGSSTRRQERSGLDRPFRRPDEPRWNGATSSAPSSARPCSSCRAARPWARSGTTTS